MDEQLRFKRGRVVAALRPYGASIEIAEVVPADPVVGYRTRVKWMTGPGATLGLFARDADHVVVDVPSCRVASAPCLAVGAAIREAMRAGEPRWARSVADGGALFAVDLREVDGGKVLVSLVVDAKRAPSLDAARAVAERLAAAAPVAGVALNLHTEGAPQVLGAETRVVTGEGAAWDTPGLARVRAMHGSFVQAHRGQAARIQTELRRVLAELPGATRVLDVYGGSGAIALALAGPGVTVDLVESFAPAARAAEEAAVAAALAVRAIPGDAGVVTRGLAADGARWDVVVVNPPRRGLTPEVRRAVATLALARIAYVSCEPTTLARDLAHFARLGWAPSSLRPYDMIPLTDEVETLAILSPAPAPPPVVLHEDDDLVVVAKEAHEATHALVTRVRDLVGCAGVVAFGELDEGTSGVCVLARRAETRDRALVRLAESERTFLAMVRGITSPRGSVARPVRRGAEVISPRTRYVRLEVAGGHSVVEARPSAGGDEVVRRHLAGLGHPVLGDERLGHAPSNRHVLARFGLDRPFLHASRLSLPSVSGEPLVIDAPLPGDLASVREAARAQRTSPAARK
jgi:23S rRNA (uracil1939-C5)-methyltransferase